MIDTKKLREIVDKATPGPWKIYGQSLVCEKPSHIEYVTDTVFREDDQLFILAARSVLPELLEELERLREENEELESVVHKLARNGSETAERALVRMNKFMEGK